MTPPVLGPCRDRLVSPCSQQNSLCRNQLGNTKQVQPEGSDSEDPLFIFTLN